MTVPLVELYSHPCSVLSKLCPRPRPPSLESATLRVLARIDPLLLSRLFGVDVDTLETVLTSIRELMETISRGRCPFCGRRAVDAWEHWRYYVAHGAMRGRAVLYEITPVCERCRRALLYKPGSLDKDVIKWLSKINRVKKDEVRNLLRMITLEYETAALPVAEWEIDVQKLDEHRVESVLVRILLEKLLDDLFDVRGDSFIVKNVKLESMIFQIVSDDVEAICSRRLDAARLARKAREANMRPDWEGLETLIDKFFAAKMCKRDTKQLVYSMRGAWRLELTREARADLVARIALELLEDNMSWLESLETPLPPMEPAEVLAYAPSFASPDLVKRVADELASALAYPLEMSFHPIDPATGRLADYSIYHYSVGHYYAAGIA